MHDQPIPPGLCQCGCGEKTRPAPQSDPVKGWVRGQPLRFVMGHARRSSPVDYIVDPDTGCWVWQLAKTPAGYGMWQRNGVQGPAHRVFYARAKGAVPHGLQLDHLCRNRACVNPDHLEAVTQSENLRRAPRQIEARARARKVVELVESGMSQAAAGRAVGLSRFRVYRIWREHQAGS